MNLISRRLISLCDETPRGASVYRIVDSVVAPISRTLLEGEFIQKSITCHDPRIAEMIRYESIGPLGRMIHRISVAKNTTPLGRLNRFRLVRSGARATG